MVVVRESPRAKHTTDENDAQWPPKSPFAALVSSPSGRKRWQNVVEKRLERSPSPSVRSISQARHGNGDASDEEDEETIALRLAEIQAKLKLKELQRKAKKLAEPSSQTHSNVLDAGPTVIKTSSVRQTTTRPVPAQPTIEVPLSPVRSSIAPVEHLSPARRKLGLQEARKATEVSLKRPRSLAFPSLNSTTGVSIGAVPGPGTAASKPLTFSERLAASRDSMKSQEARLDRIENARSKGFGGQPTAFAKTSSIIERKSNLNELHDPFQSKPAFRMPDSASTANSQPKAKAKAKPNLHDKLPPRTQIEGSGASFEAFSETHLSKRDIEHTVIAREMETREVYTLPRLLKEVKSPHYDPPDCEKDFVVFAILASKSSPFDQKSSNRTTDEHDPQEDANAPRNKFMVFKLTDLKWEVDCFLFGTAFDQFWKLTPGTLIAILNPGIMPPKGNSATGRFSLKLSSSEDCVMEIGMARDLGYCESTKRDGKKCLDWLDKRTQSACDFHLNLRIEASRRQRMEVNTMHRGPKSGYEPKKYFNSRKIHGGELQNYEKEKQEQHWKNHPEYGKLYTMPLGIRNSAAKMLDLCDPDAMHGMTREEASRKRIAAAQKERDLAKALGVQGNGAGAEYLRASFPSTDSRSDPSNATSTAGGNAKGMFDKPKAADLGLLNNRAVDIHLSPAKDRKRHFGLGVGSIMTTAGGSQAMGWGGAKKPGLIQPKDSRKSPERGQTTLDQAIKPKSMLIRDRSPGGSLSPKKRARFALEKGIREPGRESLGGEDLAVSGVPKRRTVILDDDDLDIV